MRVEILRVLDEAARRVTFRCAVGAATGVWQGSVGTGPADVEFDVPDEDVVLTILPAPASGSIRDDDSSVVVTGTVAAVGEDDDDPVLTIRVGSDLLLLESPTWRPVVRVGDGVELRTPELHLHPYQL